VKLNFSIKEICSVLQVEHQENNSSSETLIQNVIIDSRSPRISSSTIFFALAGHKTDGHNFIDDFAEKGGIVAVVSKVNSESSVIQLLVDDVLEALQTLAAFHRQRFDFPVIGITGSNGKTIVKEWLYHVLKDNFSIVRSPKSFNSQIGVALSVLEMEDSHTLGIFEAGISRPNEMVSLEKIIQPTIGIFTGLGDAHSNNFESNDQKKAEKYLLFKNAETIIEGNEETSSEIPFTDYASKLNAKIVEETAEILGLDKNQIANQLKNLPIVSMRLEQINGKNNCLLLNDAYNADMTSLEIAISHLKQFSSIRSKTLVLSRFEDIKSEDQDGLVELINSSGLDKIILLGWDKKLPNINSNALYFGTVDEFMQNPIKFKDEVILFKGSRKYQLEKLVQLYAEQKHITHLEISLASLRNNLNVYRSKIKDKTKLLAMIKAQSYGAGLIEMAQFFESELVDYFGVAYADEGVELRKSGITTPIIVMNPEEIAFSDILEFDLEPSIYSMELLQSFIHFLILNQKKSIPIHLKLDTGMNRLGFVSDEISDLIAVLKTQPEIYVKSVFSHLAVSDDPAEKSFTLSQIDCFRIMSTEIEKGLGYSFDAHIANSAAILNYPNSHFDMVRVGIGLFGLIDNNVDLVNVLAFKTQISQIKKLKKGDSLGYGRSFVAEGDKTIGIIPVGYADGLSRRLSNGQWAVIVGGVKAPIIGTICMDMCMIDISSLDAKVGDVVEIFGAENSITAMADILETIPYEIISSISTRVHRIYLESSKVLSSFTC
jgi:alanine racemase